VGLFANILCRGFQLLTISCAHRYAAAFCGKGFGGRQPNALAGGSNDRNAVFNS
jgi:hypothetical protein